MQTMSCRVYIYMVVKSCIKSNRVLMSNYRGYIYMIVESCINSNRLLMSNYRGYIYMIVKSCIKFNRVLMYNYTRLFISPSWNSGLDCATTKTDTAESGISIGRESLKVFCTTDLGVLPGSTARW